MKRVLVGVAGLAMFCLLSADMNAQTPGQDKGKPQAGQDKGKPQPGRPGGAGGIGGFARLSPLMQALDTNNDGELSADEIKNATAALAKLDKNKDGKLSEDELRPAGGFGAPGGGFGRPGAGGFGGRGTDPKEMIERLKGFDKNKDGKLSKDELPELFQAQFDRADANKDGVLDDAEIKQLAEGAGRGATSTGRPQRPGGDGKDKK